MNKIFEYKITIIENQVSGYTMKQVLKEALFFKASEMRFNTGNSIKRLKYSEKKFNEMFPDDLSQKEKFSCELYEGIVDSTIKMTKRGDYVFLKLFVFSGAMSESDKRIDSLILKLARSNQLVVACKVALDDDYIQNSSDIEVYRKAGYQDSELLIGTGTPPFENLCVNKEGNPGHNHYYNNVVGFGSCYKMWFGKAYFQFVPKEVLTTFKDCYLNQEVDNGAVLIQLHENIWDYRDPENRRRQWAFRKHTQIDDAYHKFERRMAFENPQDPMGELLNTNLKYGGKVGYRYFLDNNGKAVPKSEATRIRYTELDEKGNTICSEIIDKE